MPMPTPRNDESRTEFMNRCMGDGTMRREFQDDGQRAAVCARQWSDAKMTQGVWTEKLEASSEIKLLSEDGQFEGYASIFGDLDQGNDIVMPGAFADSLVKTPAPKIKMLWHHDPQRIVGKWLEAREDNRGLYVKGQIFTDLHRGQEIRLLMKEGALDGLSIGYRTLVDEVDRQTGVRRLMKLDLREISVVTFPMLATATVQLVKGDVLPTEREFERWLVREAGFSARQAKAIIADGYKSLRIERDAGMGDEDASIDALHRLAELLRA